MKCNSCGNELREGAEFCSFCGEKVGHKNISVNNIRVKGHKVFIICIICLVVVLFGLLITISLINNKKVDNEIVEEVKVIDTDGTPSIDNSAIDESLEEFEENTDYSHILYSNSYYMSNITGILSAISECQTDIEKLELLEKYCISERAEMLNAEDSLYFYSEYGSFCPESSYIEYGRKTDYTYDDDDNLLSTHSYYQDGFLVRESNDSPLQLNYLPSYDFTDENKEKINIVLKGWNEKESSVILGNESKDHMEQFNEDNNYLDFDNCRSVLEYNGYSTDDVEKVYVNCEVTSYFDADDLLDIKVKGTSSEAYGDIIKLKDGTWLFGCYEGGGSDLDIDDEGRLLATVSYSEQDAGGSVTFYYYDKKDEDASYDINPLYFDFLAGKIPAKSMDDDPYYISDNPRTNVYLEDSQSGVFFYDLDNDGEFEMHIADYFTGSCGIVFNIDNGELIEWIDGGPIVNAPLYNDMNWVKYYDAAWIYSTAERYAWGIRMEKYSGTDIVDSFEIIDKLLEDGETHMYSYRDQIVSEEEFKNIYKGIFKHEYWGY